MEYNVENIRQLAEKYFRGETTLAEEAALREHFGSAGEVPADLQPCRLLFGAATAAADLMIKVIADPKLPAQRHRHCEERSNPVATAAGGNGHSVLKTKSAAGLKLPAQRPCQSEPARRPLRRGWVAVTSGIAAAAAVLTAVFVTMDFNRLQANGGIVCYVNGQLITDRQAAMEYTQEAIEIINAKLQEPAGYISPKTGNSPTMELVGDMLDALTAETEEE